MFIVNEYGNIDAEGNWRNSKGKVVATESALCKLDGNLMSDVHLPYKLYVRV